MSSLIDQPEIHRLAESEEINDRKSAASSLGSTFSKLPDKDLSWQDLHLLAQDCDISVRRVAAESLGSAFPFIPNKELAWQDLHKLSHDLDEDVRRGAASAFGFSFRYIPDKNQAWEDLHNLTIDSDASVRREAAEAICPAIEFIPDKDSALEDLTMLTKDQHSKVRVSAYNSIGRIFILNATLTHDKKCLRNDLEKAIDSFEKSVNEDNQNNSAKFCLAFYRSYFILTFQDAEEDEIQLYLTQAREAVGESKKKEDLLKAVENLARALQESHKLQEKPLLEMATELNAYRWYCEKAAEYMTTAQEAAPSAVKLMRKCNPLLEEKIQAIINEIQEKANQICKVVKGSGTKYEALGTEIHRAAKCLNTEDIAKIQKCTSRMVSQLRMFCRILPEGNKTPICEIIKEIEREPEFPEKLQKIELALAYALSTVETSFDQNCLRNQIDEIEYEIIHAPSEKVSYDDVRKKYEVFISYNPIDVDEVIKIAEYLKEHGIKPWIDIWDLQPGQPIREFYDKLVEIESIAVFVGKDGVAPWQNLETRDLLARSSKHKSRIIPVVLKSSPKEPELPIFMRSLVWVDFRKDTPNPYEQLIWGIKGKKVDGGSPF
ncbi:MAG: TIR domain-containing protein [Methanotrichaceae archaeon]|jgi:hypothetical protein